jgi:hypothetical protein
MSTRFSKVLILIEGLVLVVPVGALFLTLVPGALFFFRSIAALGASLLVAAIGASFAGALGLMGAFWSRGAEGLRSAPKSWWRLGAMGAVISITGLLSTIIRHRLHLPGNDFLQVLGLSSFGLPLLLPLGHLALEYFFRGTVSHAA